MFLVVRRAMYVSGVFCIYIPWKRLLSSIADSTQACMHLAGFVVVCRSKGSGGIWFYCCYFPLNIFNIFRKVYRTVFPVFLMPCVQLTNEMSKMETENESWRIWKVYHITLHRKFSLCCSLSSFYYHILYSHYDYYDDADDDYHRLTAGLTLHQRENKVDGWQYAVVVLWNNVSSRLGCLPLPHFLSESLSCMSTCASMEVGLSSLFVSLLLFLVHFTFPPLLFIMSPKSTQWLYAFSVSCL